MKKRIQNTKKTQKSNAEELLERVMKIAIEKGFDIASQEVPKLIEKFWSKIFSNEEEKKPNVASTKDSKAQGKIITPDFSAIGDENWWEVLSLNINATEEEIHEAAAKLLAKNQSTKSVSDKTLKAREEKRKRVLNACFIGIATIRAKNNS
jgi:hypothetical protein